jgi:gluconolactonase
MVDSYWANENCRPSVYRWDPSGRLDLVVTEEQIPDPNGILFSPDYKKLYVISTGKGPGGHRPGRQRRNFGLRRRLGQQVLESKAVHRLRGRWREVRAGRRGRRCGWQSLGLQQYGAGGWLQRRDGVTAWNPAGKLIGRIRIPEVVGNVCFGGPKRNRLFMAGSRSLYALYTSIQGAAPG